MINAIVVFCAHSLLYMTILSHSLLSNSLHLFYSLSHSHSLPVPLPLPLPLRLSVALFCCCIKAEEFGIFEDSVCGLDTWLPLKIQSTDMDIDIDIDMDIEVDDTVAVQEVLLEEVSPVREVMTWKE